MKTGFDFGALSELPQIGDDVFVVIMLGREVNPFQYQTQKWKDSHFDNFSFREGEVFATEEDCKNYCKYMNTPPIGQNS